MTEPLNFTSLKNTAFTYLNKLSIPVRYGIYSGLLTSTYMLVEFILGLHTKYYFIGRFTGYGSYAILIYFLYKAISLMRQEKGDSFKYWDGIKNAFILSTIAGAIFAGFFFAYDKVLNPNWLKFSINEQRTFLKAQKGADHKKIDEMMAKVQKNYRIEDELSFIFTGTVINGVVLSLIFTLIIDYRAKSQNKKSLAVEKKVEEKEPEVLERVDTP